MIVVNYFYNFSYCKQNNNGKTKFHSRTQILIKSNYGFPNLQSETCFRMLLKSKEILGMIFDKASRMSCCTLSLFLLKSGLT